MRLGGFQPVVRADGPYATVSLDVSRTTENADQELRLRWKAVAGALRSDGAPSSLVDAVGERMLEPTRHGGELRRYVVATADGILSDVVAPEPSTSDDHGHFGPLPHLMPVARLLAGHTPYVLVKVDHTGADIMFADATGLDARHWRTEGDHDVIHKVPGGGWSHRRYQSRVEDSWDRNGEQVAEELDKLLTDHPGEPVFLVGDPYARSVVLANASGRIADRMTDLGPGSRAAGGSDEALEGRIETELAAYRRAGRDRLLARYQEQDGRSEAVATNLTEVIRSVREGSLESLLLVDRPDASERLWAGPHPTQVGRTPDELDALGVDLGYEDRADEVVLRAVVDLDGEVELFDEPSALLPDGIGGLLRFDTGRVRST
jgi:Bacterial archaeo-eukaryotic release factor family 2